MPWTYRDVSRGAFLYTELQPHWDTCCRLAVETIRRNLSAAACMDYASPATAQSPPPRTGASCWAVAEISECNPYMSQHLDSLRVSTLTYDRYSSEAAVLYTKTAPSHISVSPGLSLCAAKLVS